jgi:colicin import membrane protein
MSSFVRQHKGAVVWSLALHVAVLTAVVIGLPWFETPRAPVATAVVPIEAVMIDSAAIERAQQQRDEAARQERQRQQREERQRREAAEQQRQTEQREQQRVANEQRARDEAAQKERERVAAEKAEQTRKEEQARVAREQQAREQREKEAQAQKEREENAKRERERAAQRQREEDMLRAAAVEAEANAARNAGLQDEYVRLIEGKIKQNWDRPLSARVGIDCTVNVVQLPSGDVMSAVVGACNGDDAVRQSIERAVRAASPLPKPPNPALFQRNLNVRFQPDE